MTAVTTEKSTEKAPSATKSKLARRPVQKRTPAAEKIGGVAPFVRPPSRFAVWKMSQKWGRKGFVPLSPGREKRRHRILPRTVIGISSMLLSLGVGAAFAGAAFYSYYDNRLAENERQIARFVDGFDQQFADASGALDELRVDSVEQIREELVPLGEYTTDARGVLGLPATAGPSVWTVETLGLDGRPVIGTAFAITGHQGGTALVTSFDLVQASGTNPAPTIELVKGDQRLSATLWSWDEANDLALLLIAEEIPVLSLASPTSQVNSLGGRIFAMSGLGGQGATASPGVLIDDSALGLQHTAIVGTFFEGGPLVNGEGFVLGVATTSYRPLGVDPGLVAQGPDVAAICERILQCADSADSVTIEVTDEGE